MARVTVEDCVRNIANRFELVLSAALRARELGFGAEPTLPWDGDRKTVLALREIAAGTVTPQELREKLLATVGTGLREEPPPEDDLFSTDLLKTAAGETGRREAGAEEVEPEGLEDPDRVNPFDFAEDSDRDAAE